MTIRVVGRVMRADRSISGGCSVYVLNEFIINSQYYASTLKTWRGALCDNLKEAASKGEALELKSLKKERKKIEKRLMEIRDKLDVKAHRPPRSIDV